jgi:hypothetical protein
MLVVTAGGGADAVKFAVRIALGASRGRLFRVLAMETTILAAAGAAPSAGGLHRSPRRCSNGQTGLDIPALADVHDVHTHCGRRGSGDLFVWPRAAPRRCWRSAHATLATSLRGDGLVRIAGTAPSARWPGDHRARGGRRPPHGAGCSDARSGRSRIPTSA